MIFSFGPSSTQCARDFAASPAIRKYYDSSLVLANNNTGQLSNFVLPFCMIPWQDLPLHPRKREFSPSAEPHSSENHPFASLFCKNVKSETLHSKSLAHSFKKSISLTRSKQITSALFRKTPGVTPPLPSLQPIRFPLFPQRRAIFRPSTPQLFRRKIISAPAPNSCFEATLGLL